ncbi:EF-hand-like domain protein [Akanthomyces lecanii RCEF 1005]|uniref:EF-hand-like domain protein n=1 Tax=Akanthomyces lecanii RCEF 1005 TaxID=1081108 RepID=A0A168C0J0_CORDF|nr:EF-hand-like domain protein [Akanthomyces lecanii RCEF 1005]
MFHQECQGKPYLTGVEAAIIFLDSHLHKHVLSNIWEQADVTRDGRFSCDEFCVAMWLIDQEKGNYSSQTAPTSTHQNVSSWTQPPAYPQQTQQQNIVPPSHVSYGVAPPPGPPPSSAPSNHVPYEVAPPPGPPPQSTGANPPAAAYNPYTPQAMAKREMLDPMICQACDTGLVSGDTVYRCDECEFGISTFCDSCHGHGQRCYHEVAPAKLEPGKDLKNQNKDGDLGFGLKCDGCKTKLREGMLCWHCKSCFEPNFCSNCWRRSDKRCKHSGQGKNKVQLRMVGKSSTTTGEVLDSIDIVSTILGG